MDRIRQLEELLADDPADPFLAYALAQEYTQAGRTMEALMCYEQLVNDQPDYVPTYYHYASVLHGLGNRNEAVRLMEKGIEAGMAAGDQHAVSEMKGLLALWTLGMDEDE